MSDETRRPPVPSEPAAAQSVQGRVIQPAGEGILLEDSFFQLQDVGSLAETLTSHAQGKLERLQREVTELEGRIESQVNESQGRIRRALEMTDRLVRTRLEESSRRATEILEERYREGHEEGRKAGFRAGYEEGLAAGLREGRTRGEEAARRELTESFTEETATLRASLTGMLERLEQSWSGVFDGARDDLLKLVMGIAGDVVCHQVTEVPEIIERKIEVALDRVARSHRITVEVNPHDLGAARRHLAELSQRLDGSAAVAVEEHAEIDRGGCRVRGEDSTVDLTLETQRSIIERRLLEAGGASV